MRDSQAVDGGKGGGEQILSVFERRLTDNIEKLNFKNMLSPVNVKRIVEEADGYQPHLIAPEMGYRRLLTECLVLFKVGRPCFWIRSAQGSGDAGSRSRLLPAHRVVGPLQGGSP